MKSTSQLILGKIFIIDSKVLFRQAMYVENGIIKYIGSKQVALKFCKKNTKVLDYGNNYVYPGFMDAHTHGLMAAVRMKISADLTSGKSLEDYVKIMKSYIAKKPNATCYQGAGWVQYGQPTAAMLDAICKDKPIVLSSSDGHSQWLNSKALALAGIDKAKAKELGTDIIRVDDNGNPIGQISEIATSLTKKLTLPTTEELKEGLLAWQEFAFKNGLTGVVEALADYFPNGMEAYKQLVDEGKWKLRTYAYPAYMQYMGKDPLNYVNQLKKDIKKYSSEYFQIIGLKMFIDGVAEAHTACMLKPYSDQKDYYGVNYFTGKQKYLNKVVQTVNKAGYPVHFHAIGDGAVKTAMDAIEYSCLTNKNVNLTNCLAHLQFVSKNDIQRMADYNTIAIIAPLWFPVYQPSFNNQIGYLGQERSWNEYPARSFEKAGVTLAFHTDYPVSSKISTSDQFYCAVKRESPKLGPSSVKNPDEGIDPIRSLQASTIDIAYMVKQWGKIGVFDLGTVANATVFNINFLECDPEKVNKAKLVATVVDGQEVYKAQ